ncbi:hypothetical protein F7C95_12875 [Opitutia bacterium ISCC 51]|nr:hypothetical protein F7C95_12875 [Opitutae bacterium ISCC 51]QXD26908.1 hypothetical protein GA003_12800 [Opitutae bacterium ISCC 52]
MKHYTFYQLLDRELPRAIVGASQQLTKRDISEDVSSLFSEGVEQSLSYHMEKANRKSSVQNIYPMAGSRSGHADSCSRTHAIKEVRDSLGQMSLAYVISNYEPFAEFAEQLVGQEIIANGLLSIDELNGSFSLQGISSTEHETHSLMAEVILGLEMIQGLGLLGSKLTKELSYALSRRLRALERKSVGSLSLLEQLGCLLERILISLFLAENETFDKASYQFQKGHLAHLAGEESISCLEVYFALCYWIDQGQGGEGQLLTNTFNKLQSKLCDHSSASIPRGAWVQPRKESKFETILRDTSLLLLLGEEMDKPDIIDCWIEGLEGRSNSRPFESHVLTRPLLWIGSEEWAYRPFVRTRMRTSIPDRL